MLLEHLSTYIINSIIAFLILVVCINFYAMLNKDFAMWIISKLEEAEENARKRREKIENNSREK